MDEVKIVYVVRCKHCGHDHETERWETLNVDYAPAPVPHRCDNCDNKMKNTPLAYAREHQLKEIV